MQSLSEKEMKIEINNNEYDVVVTATDGTTSTYKIIINRERYLKQFGR